MGSCSRAEGQTRPWDRQAPSLYRRPSNIRQIRISLKMFIHRNLFLLLAGLVACSFVEASPMKPETTTAVNTTTAANTNTAVNTTAVLNMITEANTIWRDFMRIINKLLAALNNNTAAANNNTPETTGHNAGKNQQR